MDVITLDCTKSVGSLGLLEIAVVPPALIYSRELFCILFVTRLREAAKIGSKETGTNKTLNFKRMMGNRAQAGNLWILKTVSHLQ